MSRAAGQQPAAWLQRLSRRWVVFLLVGVGFFMLLVKPTTAPAPWFDEGWTLSVARNWVEKGIYARLLLDQPVSFYDTAWPFPVTGLVGISFRLLGVGVWQGRLPNILYTLGCLALLYSVGRQLYNKWVAGLCLVMVLFASVNLHPVFIGRQAIAEMPMLFFLLAGFALWLPALRGSGWALSMAVLCWGLSITIKLHPLPFVLFMLIISIVLGLVQKDVRAWRTAILALAGTLAAYALFYNLDRSLSARLPRYGETTPFLFTTSVLVLDPATRRETLVRALTLGGPLIFSLGYLGWNSWRSFKEKDTSPTFYARAGYFALTAGWLGWLPYYR